MKQNIIDVAVTAVAEDATDTLQVGKMYEHNATALRFVLEEALISSEYRYYTEFVTVHGVARTAYVTPDSNRQITVELPVEITSQMTALCVLNIVKIAENGKTEQVIKAKSVRLYFSALENTDRLLDANHTFSVNQLLEAIQAGTFKGERGPQGIRGVKGDKGDKGEPAVPVDSTVTAASANPVASSGIFSFVTGKTERLIASVELGQDETPNEIFITKDMDGKPFALRSLKIFAKLVYDAKVTPICLRIRTDSGVRYLTHQPDITADGTLYFFHTAETVSNILAVGQTVCGIGGQGVDTSDRTQHICTRKCTPFTDIRFAVYERDATTRLPLLAGTKVMIYGTDAE